ncbi:phaC PHA synthase, partial [Vibrio splendidus]
MKKLLSVLAVSAAVMAPAAFASSPVMFSTINGFNAPDSDAVGGVRVA